MSRYTGPRLKVLRALGIDLPGLSRKSMQERNQPLNEITALMSGGQVQQPGSPNWAGYGVAAPDLAGNIYQSYNQQQAQNNATMGGLFGLGGTIAGGLFGF